MPSTTKPQLAILARNADDAAAAWAVVDPGFTQYPIIVTSLAQLPNLRDIVVVVVPRWREALGNQHADVARMLTPPNAAARGWTVLDVTI